MIRDREADHVVDVAEDHRLAAHPTEDADVQEIAATPEIGIDVLEAVTNDEAALDHVVVDEAEAEVESVGQSAPLDTENKDILVTDRNLIGPDAWACST